MKYITGIVAVILLAFGTASAQNSSDGNDASGSKLEEAAKAAAQAEAEELDPNIGEKLWDIIQSGGVMMYPIAGLSFVAVLLIVFYFLTIRQRTVVSDSFMNKADSLIRNQDYLGLIAVCNRNNEAIARVTYKTLDFATKNPTASFEEVREVTEAEGTRQASILTQRIAYLSDIGAIAPMVGLLGTVIGMIKAFGVLGTAVEALQTELSRYVSEALITTAGGLVVGIPALIFYSLFRGRVQKLIAELEAASTHIMALLASQYKRATSRAVSRDHQMSSMPDPNLNDVIRSPYPLGRDTLDPRGL
jgi:biopolymer transport protein ExbB